MKIPPLTSEKKKKLLIKGAGVAAVVFLVIMFFMSSGNKVTDNQENVRIKNTRIKLPTEGVDVAEKQWVLQADTIIKSLKKTIRENRESINEITNRTNYLEESLKKITSSLNDLSVKVDLLNKRLYNSAPPTSNVDSIYNSPLPPPRLDFIKPKRIKVFMPDNHSEADSFDTLSFLTNSVKNDTSTDSIFGIIPPGSFVRGRILAGVNAPTGGSEPYPVLIEITDPINTPSFETKNIESAFVIGSAMGDLASERANIRLEKLVFYYRDGSVFDEPVKGWVVDGNDGEYGVKGKLISKEGRFIGTSLLAGFAGGLSKAVEAAGKVTTVSPIGSVTSTISKEMIARVATASGISKAAEMLADFYIDKAKKLFPVVEIKPGIPVDIVFMDEIRLKEEALNDKNNGFLGVD